MGQLNLGRAASPQRAPAIAGPASIVGVPQCSPLPSPWPLTSFSWLLSLVRLAPTMTLFTSIKDWDQQSRACFSFWRPDDVIRRKSTKNCVSSPSWVPPPAAPPHTHTSTETHSSWFVLERGHILLTSSTLKQLHLWVFPPLLCAASCSKAPGMTKILPFRSRGKLRSLKILLFVWLKATFISLFSPSSLVGWHRSHWVLFCLNPVQTVRLSGEANPPCVNTS